MSSAYLALQQHGEQTTKLSLRRSSTELACHNLSLNNPSHCHHLNLFPTSRLRNFPFVRKTFPCSSMISTTYHTIKSAHLRNSSGHDNYRIRSAQQRQQLRVSKEAVDQGTSEHMRKHRQLRMKQRSTQRWSKSGGLSATRRERERWQQGQEQGGNESAGLEKGVPLGRAR